MDGDNNLCSVCPCVLPYCDACFADFKIGDEIVCSYVVSRGCGRYLPHFHQKCYEKMKVGKVVDKK